MTLGNEGTSLILVVPDGEAMAKTTDGRSDLTDLVDYPRETLDIELKDWIDLGDKVAQAKLARHIAALANHGGGYLVFGFRDDESIAPSRPTDLSGYSRDTFGRVVTRYLTPAFQCDVQLIQSSAGLIYPVVRVPSHGSTPIGAKADGPHDPKGQPQGIRAGTYYVRKPGPKSEAAMGVEDWQPLIRRCILFDRDSLLGDIARAVQPRSEPPAPAIEDRLKTWHGESEARWRAILGKATALRWLVDIEANHCQLSYMILSDTGIAIPAHELQRVLAEVNRDVRQTVWTGWSMFYPFTRPEIAAALHPEFDDGSGVDVLESNLIGDGDFDISLPDYWRFAVDGRAPIIRPYREDRQRSVEGKGRPAGTWLSPETIVRETAELVTHARIVAERYEGSRVAFRCTWRGLAGREIDDFGDIYWSPGRHARADQRTTIGTWDVPVLAANWHEVVAQLSCPVLNLFGFTECGGELVAGLAPRFIKL
uniref:ATPase AAA n=2 Tax=Rhizobium leguminosarum TaxID=384 RepID=A0A1C9HYS9_RHILT|nr:ATPase AAA [Rhizobium leguminosarum bv. trifolii]